ncbi:hypothetical protein [Thalassomonas haliotis]|uniref:Uncharacterized protein n=1 Tax=Thalassomonas haliotis TaxID=485448 RepID=A0ABY7VHK3_9GAMM|nr:hypothetical protein [Thalassomonas haliotis]WDE12948.1 hypothetical protein H3N35_05680 [Thalassomonas haliotis]
MSETIIGYINLIPKSELIALEKDVQQVTPFGFYFIDELKLYNYPMSEVKSKDIVQFVIADSNDSDTATILLGDNYDPEEELEDDFLMQFPALLKDRILAITKIIKQVVQWPSVREIGFSISFCDEVNQVKHGSITSFEDTVVLDCMNSCPPSTLYILEK